MIAILETTDAIKLTAAQSALAADGVASEVFDRAAAGLWGAAIRLRLMVDDGDAARARRALAGAGFVEAADGEWDLRG